MFFAGFAEQDLYIQWGLIRALIECQDFSFEVPQVVCATALLTPGTRLNPEPVSRWL